MNEQFLGLSPNAWAAILTFVLAGIAAVQALIYGLQLRTAHRAERAYVYVEGISNLENFGRGLMPTIEIDIKNSGRTPARILAANVVHWVERDGKKLPGKIPLRARHLIPIDFWMITGRGALPFSVSFKEPISASDFDDIMAARRKFFVFGQVRYRDRFQWLGSHYTNFSFVLDHRKRLPTDPDGTTNAFGFSVANESYNDAN